jgi:hypothetical protein
MVPGIDPAVPAVVMLIPTLGPWWWRGRSTASSLWKTGVALGRNFSCMYTTLPVGYSPVGGEAIAAGVLRDLLLFRRRTSPA